MSAWTGFVTCSEHNTRRKASYCSEVPIYNADHEVIGSTFVCAPGNECTMGRDVVRTGRAGAHTGDARNSTPTSGNNTNRDLSSAGAAVPASVVFDCSSSRSVPSCASGSDAAQRGSHASRDGDAPANALFSVSFTRIPKAATAVAEGASANAEDNVEDGGAVSSDGHVDGGDGESDADSEVRVVRVVPGPDDCSGHSSPSLQVSMTAAAAATAAITTPFTATARQPRAPARYYDLANNASRGAGAGASGGAGAHMPRKVCWNCGLSGHEKPDCPNTLCRMCHDLRTMSQYHHCTDIREPSPFVVVPTKLQFTHPSPTISPAAKAGTDCGGFDAVQCVRCGCYGHMDCGPTTQKQLHDHFAKLRKEYAATMSEATSPTMATRLKRSFPTATAAAASVAAEPLTIGGVNVGDLVTFQRASCCFCSGVGHNGYDCMQRERVAADRWVSRNLHPFSSQASATGGDGGSAYHTNSVNSHPSNNYNGGGGGGRTYSQVFRDPKLARGGEGHDYGRRGYDQRSSSSNNNYSHHTYNNSRGYSDDGSRRDRRRDREHDRDSDYHRQNRGNRNDSCDGDRDYRDRRMEGGGNESSGNRSSYPSSSAAPYSTRDRSVVDHSSNGGGHGGHGGHGGTAPRQQRDMQRPHHDGGDGRWGRDRKEEGHSHQGRGRRGGRSGYSGFSDEEALY